MWIRLLRAGPGEWARLLEAQFWILWAGVRVRFLPRGRLVTAVPPRSGEDGANPKDRQRVHRIETSLVRVARRGLGRPACLVRSMALERMLRAHGVAPTRVRFGVRQREGTFESHAWVEWGDRIVGDDLRHIRSYTPIDDLALTDRSLRET